MSTSIQSSVKTLEEDDSVKEEREFLKHVVDHYDKQEKAEREFRVREWKKYELMFRGYQKLMWDDVSKDFVTPEGMLRRASEDGVDPKVAERIVNIYRAHIESIIAAVTAAYPQTRFEPGNADDPLDISTAKEYTKIAELLERSNKMNLQFIYAMFVIYNQGLVYAYNYNHQSGEYGSYEDPQYGIEQVNKEISVCEWCGNEIDKMETMCENCGEETEPIPFQQEEEEEVLVGINSEDKTRECIEVYGPLHVKVPFWLKSLKDTPYLILYSEQAVAMMKELYPEASFEAGGKDSEAYDRWSRSSTSGGRQDQDIVTLRRVWIRNWALNTGESKYDKIREKLKKRFKKGILVTLVEDEVVKDPEENNIDDHWTATEYPLSSHLHNEPLGKPLVAIQEIQNELIGIILATIFFGIPELWADPEFVDFKAYKNSVAQPGMLYPARKPPNNQSMDSLFYRNQPATLSKEVTDFLGYLGEMAQFSLGAFPSIFGGSNDSGSGTFAEYEMSRNQAMQRLSLVWKTITEWIPAFTLKAVKSHHSNMSGDDNMVNMEGASPVNIPIKRDAMLGKIGNAIAETSDQFPISWPQLRGMFMEMMGTGKPYVDAVIQDPENIAFVQKVTGFGGLKIPGKADRDKQLKEIRELMQGKIIVEPQGPMMSPMTGMMEEMPPIELPSLQIDPDVDNHIVHVATIRAWGVSEEGQEAKLSNPDGYANVMAHLKQHSKMMAPPQLPGGSPEEMEQGGPPPGQGIGGDAGYESTEGMAPDPVAGLEV